MPRPHLASISSELVILLIVCGCAQTRECPIANTTSLAAPPVISLRARTQREDEPVLTTSDPICRPVSDAELESLGQSTLALSSTEPEDFSSRFDDDGILQTGALGTELVQARVNGQPPPAPAAEDSSAINDSESLSGSMSLAELEQVALANNPAIQQAAAAAQKATGIRHQVGRCPNPSVGYSGMQLGDAGTDQHVAFINQDFVTGHKLGLNERVLDHDVQVQLWEVQVQRQRVLTDIRLRFYEALAAQRRVELTHEFHTVAEKGVQVAEQRKEALEGSQPEVLQAEIQLNEVDLARQRAQFQFDAAWKELVATAGVPDMAPVHLNGNLEMDAGAIDWDAVYQNIIAASPELRAAYSRIHRAQANLERQRAQPIPNVEMELQAGADNGTGSGMVNLQLGVPIPVFNRNRGNISAAYSEYVRATQDARRLELSVKARLARVAQQFDSASATVERYREQIVPKSQQSLTLSEQAYAAGEFDFLQVLIARRTYFESNVAYVQALGDLAGANATVDGLLLTGGLDSTPDFTGDDGLRGQALSGQ